MMNFKINYDLENDDLFVYLDGAKSKGSIEAGNFVFDFDEKGNLVAIQIIEASKTLKILLSRLIQLTNITKFKAEVTNYRNMASIKFSISDDSYTETANIIIPRIIKESPSLKY